MTRPTRLSKSFVERVTQPGAYGDSYGGHGLTLRVTARARGGVAKNWVQRLRWHGVPLNLGLGPHPIVTLEEARDAALDNARKVRHGVDPRAERRAAAPAVPSFREVARVVHRLHSGTWRNPMTAKIWISSMETYVFPKIGGIPVNAVSSADVLRVLTPLWATKRETGRRLRQRIGAVLRHAIAQGWRTDDPTGPALTAALPKSATAPARHHRALPHAEVPAALAKVRASGAGASTKLLLEYVVLTAARSGEARLARWSEVDIDKATWTVPASRMKSGRQHVSPLSTRALEVLAEAKGLRDETGLLFPSPRGKALSNMATTKLLNDTGIDGTTHGFRTSFRSWCADMNESRELAEMALAHVVPGVEGAYQRSDMLDRRRQLMQRWAAYLTK